MTFFLDFGAAEFISKFIHCFPWKIDQKLTRNMLFQIYSLFETYEDYTTEGVLSPENRARRAFLNSKPLPQMTEYQRKRTSGECGQ